MDFKPFEDQYYVVKRDIRQETESNHIEVPFIKKHSTLNNDMDLDWWNNEPMELQHDLALSSREKYIETPEAFEEIDLLYTSTILLMKKDIRNSIMHLMPPQTQWIPSYISTSKGSTYHEWWGAHIWKLWDCWDRKRSIREEYNGEVFDNLAKIYLDESKLFNVPEKERLIIRLDAMDTIHILLHEKLVKLLLEQQAKGVLFVPLRLFDVGLSWWYDNSEEINKLHPW